MKLTTLSALLSGVALTVLASSSTFAEEIDYGKFDGYTLRVKLIGGA